MSNARPQAGIKLRDDEKVKHIPVTIIPTEKEEMLEELISKQQLKILQEQFFLAPFLNFSRNFWLFERIF